MWIAIFTDPPYCIWCICNITIEINKCLANAKRPCNCRVLCLRLKSSLCSCAQSISDMTSFGYRDQGHDSVYPVLWMSTWRNSRKRGQTVAVTTTLLRIPTKVSASADSPASYGNQTISSTRPSCWIQISTVDVINVATDDQMFMTLTSKLSWQRLRRSAVDFYSKTKVLFEPPFSALRGTYALHLWLVVKPVADCILVVLNFFAISYGWDIMSGNRSKSAFLEGVGHFQCRFQREGGIAHQPLLVTEN